MSVEGVNVLSHNDALNLDGDWEFSPYCSSPPGAREIQAKESINYQEEEYQRKVKDLFNKLSESVPSLRNNRQSTSNLHPKDKEAVEMADEVNHPLSEASSFFVVKQPKLTSSYHQQSRILKGAIAHIEKLEVNVSNLTAKANKLANEVVGYKAEITELKA